MPRPKKCRKVCTMPQSTEFLPGRATTDFIVLTVDEYESIRLIDKQGFTQEECAAFMQIARTTAQQIYNSARSKIAIALVDGIGLRIEGGDYRLCDGEEKHCGCGGCKKHSDLIRNMEVKKMKIAVTYENGQIFQHFGHTQQFKVYEIENNKVVATEVIDTNGQGHGALANVLGAVGADVLICGGIGGGAQMALADACIELRGGVSGDCDAAVEAYLEGRLDYNPDVKCNHHDEHHPDEGHKCGNHGCGSHSCH